MNDFPVLKVNHALGVGDDCGDIARHNVFSVTEASRISGDRAARRPFRRVDRGT